MLLCKRNGLDELVMDHTSWMLSQNHIIGGQLEALIRGKEIA